MSVYINDLHEKLHKANVLVKPFDRFYFLSSQREVKYLITKEKYITALAKILVSISFPPQKLYEKANDQLIILRQTSVSIQSLKSLLGFFHITHCKYTNQCNDSTQALSNFTSNKF